MKRFNRLTCNFSTAHARKEFWNGKQWTVVPAVIMTEGVRAGSEGPKLYTRQEMSKNVASWNMKPIVVDHPTDGSGEAVSACSPDIIDNQGVGLMLHTEFDGRLKTEAWFEDSKIYGPFAVEPRIGQAINARKSLEVSTGVFVEDDYSPGTYEGKEYDYIARNLRADHLAILLDREGACSRRDGCGLLTNARKGSKMPGFTGIARHPSGDYLMMSNDRVTQRIGKGHKSYESVDAAYRKQDDDDDDDDADDEQQGTNNGRKAVTNMKPFTGIVKVRNDYCFVVAGVFKGEVITPDNPMYEVVAVAYQAQDDSDGNLEGITSTVDTEGVGDRDADYPIKRAPSPSDIKRKKMGWQQPFTTGYQDSDSGHGSNAGDWVGNAALESPYDEALPMQEIMLAHYEASQRNPVANRRQEADLSNGLVMMRSGELRRAYPGELAEALAERSGQVITNAPATTEKLPMPTMDCSRRSGIPVSNQSRIDEGEALEMPSMADEF